jgi:hypothetical protein
MKQQRFLVDKMSIREAKMRRFCNFFLVSFDTKKLIPFLQYVKKHEYEHLKRKVQFKMEEFFANPEANKGKL